jgi:DNA polymerase-3 subunit epsilon
VREWQQLVNPGTRIPPFIEQLTGISNELVAAAPPFADVAEETLRRLAGRLFIAHNARFDYGFLKNEFKRLGITFRAPVLCTVKLSRTCSRNTATQSGQLIERHELRRRRPPPGAGRRAADPPILAKNPRRPQQRRIEAALQAQNARPSLPPQLDAGIVDDLPDTPGVYLFYGENNLPLYVGKAKDIRQRVLSHFAADHASAREMNLAQQVKRIDWIETAGEIGALLKEAALVKQLQPSHNRLLRKNDEVCTWTLVDEGEGWLRPQLVLADDLDFGIAPRATACSRAPRKPARRCAPWPNRAQPVRHPARPGEGQTRQTLLRLPGPGAAKAPASARSALPKHTLRLVGALAGSNSFPGPSPAGADPRRRRSPPDRRLALPRNGQKRRRMRRAGMARLQRVQRIASLRPRCLPFARALRRDSCH